MIVAIAKYLEASGYSVWMDVGEIQVGDEWSEEIVRGIRECELFVLAISPNSNNSREVKREVYLASEEKRVILPLVLPPPCKLADGIRYHLAGLQQIDVDPPRGLQELAATIKVTLAEKLDALMFNDDAISELPDKKVRAFHLRATIKAFLETMSKEVPGHLLKTLDEYQRQYYLPVHLLDHQEDALRRLRNHGLLDHDGEWLFTPTRSKRIWASPMGELLLELHLHGATKSSRLIRLAHEVTETVARIEERPELVQALRALEDGGDQELDVRFRQLRNHSQIVCRRLSTNVPLLAELASYDFEVTELGKLTLRTLAQ